MLSRKLVICFAAIVALASTPAPGRELRTIRLIRGPAPSTTTRSRVPGPVHAPWMAPILAQARAAVLRLARAEFPAMVRAWNQGNLEDYLDPGFYDREGLLRTLTARVHRDARIRLLAVERVQPLEESVTVEDSPQPQLIVLSKVSLIARTQVEFNRLVEGFQRLEGRNEFILQIRQLIPTLLVEEGTQRP